ncbi:manganese-dependent inorganic pyrophosphatase [Patescibacteria group bacterium]|nr:manganese-dependent inorganic pyrophosphatase [Patescibacteria group bacterium]
MPKTFILGHIQPDTDSVVAALGLEYLYQQKKCFEYLDPQAVTAGPLNGETKYLFERFGVTPPAQITAQDIGPDDQVVLVDHNEASQRLPNLDETQIVDIIDHHKVHLNLASPIYMTFKTWGSSTTIVFYLMQQSQVQPDKPLASLMLSAILSDTLGFKSPTCTNRDRDQAQELAKLAGIDDIEALTLDIFKAKSNVAGLSADQLATNDYKVLEMNHQKVFINQVETVEQTKLLEERQSELIAALEKVRQDMKLDLVVMAVTDILQVNTKLLLPSDLEATVAVKAFGGQVQNHVLDIGPKLSRKKEIVPALEKALQK